MKNTKVTIKQDRFGAPYERIIEVTFPDGSGCLISLQYADGLRPNTIDVYRASAGIKVTGGPVD